MKTFDVVIEGIAPLLHARHPTPKELEAITQRSAKGGKKTKALTDEEQFEMHGYTNGKKFVQPAEMIEAAMVKAATGWKMEGKKTYKDAFKSGLFVTPIEIEHEIQKFEPDARWGKNPSTGGAVWVVRPRADKWRLSFTINLLLDEKIPDEIVKAVLEYSGIYVGIGAWRPKYGRFKVVSFKETTEE